MDAFMRSDDTELTQDFPQLRKLRRSILIMTPDERTSHISEIQKRRLIQSHRPIASRVPEHRAKEAKIDRQVATLKKQGKTAQQVLAGLSLAEIEKLKREFNGR